VSDTKPIIGVFSGFLLIGILFYANSGASSIGNTGPHPRNVILDSINKPGENVLTVGNGTSFLDVLERRMVVSDGIEVLGSVVSTPKLFGAGLMVHSSQDSIFYEDVNGNGTFLGENKFICNFVDTPFNSTFVHKFVSIISADLPVTNISYKGATGYVEAIINESCFKVNTGAGGDVNLYDATNFKYVIYTHPIAAILSSGTTHFKIGNSDESLFHYYIPEAKSPQAIKYDDFVSVDSHSLMKIDLQSNNYTNVKIMEITYGAGDVAVGEDINLIDVNIDPQDATGGELHILNVALTEPDGVDVTAVATTNEINVIHQHIGNTTSNVTAFKTELTITTNITNEMNNESTITPIFVFDDDYIYVGADSKYSIIRVSLSITASQTILPIFQYSAGPLTWSTFTPTDGTLGFTSSGQIIWDSDELTSWSNETFEGFDKLWIRIQRTRNFIVTTPEIITLQLVTDDEIRIYEWDKLGNINANSLILETLITGLNGGQELCIDINNQLCVCGFCA